MPDTRRGSALGFVFKMILVFTIGGNLLALQVSPSYTLPRPILYGVLLVLAISVARSLARVAAWIRYRRWRHRAKGARAVAYRMCVRCWYSLAGSPAGGVCPECGEPYTPEDLRERWQVFL